MTAIPVQHWTFDDITGNVVNNEIPEGFSLTFGGSRTQVAGKFDYAISGGSTANVLSFDTPRYLKAISFWFQSENLAKTNHILSDQTSGKYLARYSTANGSYLFIYNGSSAVYTNLVITDTNWHHIFLLEGSDANHHWVFLDGVKCSAELLSNFNTGSLSYYFSYKYLNNTTYSNPRLDNIQVYDRIVTDAEVAFLAAATSQFTTLPMEEEPPQPSGGAVAGGTAPVSDFVIPPPSDTPLQHWTFDDITGNVVNNEIAGGATLSFSGRTQVPGKFGLALSGGGVPLYPLVASEVVEFKSISMWIKRYDMYNHAYLMSNEAENQWVLANYSTHLIGARDDTGTDNYTNLQISDFDTWHHLCMVEGSDSAHHFFYLDGVKASAEIRTDFNDFKYLSWYAYDAVSFRHPLQDNIQVYNRILTDAEVQYLFDVYSDVTTLPRLATQTIAGRGGAVAGGSIVVTGEVTTFVGSGGAVAGGTSPEIHVDFVSVSGIAPDTFGDIAIQVSPTAVVSGLAPDTYGEVGTSWSVDGTAPDTFGDIRTMHEILADVSGSAPDTFGDIAAVVSIVAGMMGVAPDSYGDIQTLRSESADIAGSAPDSYGSIVTAEINFFSISGVAPDTYGAIFADSGQATDDVLAFQEHAREASGVPGPELGMDVLLFSRGI